MTDLLILACSQRKRADQGLLPAIARYNGPSFQVLRKFLRSCPGSAHALDVYILSARFGLIPASQAIPNYDFRMTPQQASKLNSQVLAKLKRVLRGRKYGRLLVSVGKDYLQALAGYQSLIPPDLKVTISISPPGRKLSELQDWLYGDAPQTSTPSRTGAARIRGIEIKLTSEQVLDIACQALARGEGNPDSYHSWYVRVNGQRVSPKWLISQLTGLPVSSFVTDEARRVLAQLGIDVVRV